MHSSEHNQETGDSEKISTKPEGPPLFESDVTILQLKAAAAARTVLWINIAVGILYPVFGLIRLLGFFVWFEPELWRTSRSEGGFILALFLAIILYVVPPLLPLWSISKSIKTLKQCLEVAAQSGTAITSLVIGIIALLSTFIFAAFVIDDSPFNFPGVIVFGIIDLSVLCIIWNKIMRA